MNDLADMWSLFHAILLLCVAQHSLASHPIDTDRKYLKEDEEPETRADLDYRLPVGITVDRYHVEITPEIPIETSGPNKDGFPFEGSVKITLKTEWSNVSSIVLHARRLTIKSHELKKNADLVPTDQNPSFENATEKLTIKLSNDAKLEANVTYTLSIIYSGTLDDTMKGFYRSSYMEGGKRKWLGTTHFQKIEARKTFPCLDEPGFKAVFGITINRPKDFSVSLTNTPLITSTAEGDRVIEKYEETPKMSTYTVAFVVSGFKGRVTDEGETRKFGVYARPNMFDQTEYAFDVGRKILAVFGEYLDSDYYENGMKKMDMVALPDFSAGAMENWGLLTYRETGLLYDKEASSLKLQQTTANVISHEIVHMWFGNMLTCQWWEHTWMNEGFARYFQYHGTAMVEKDWDLEHQFVVDHLQNVFQFDSTDSSHPMSHPVNSPSEIADIFNIISYSKGAVFMRMIKFLIGDDNFQDVLQNYVKENRFQSVVPKNFYDAYEKVMKTKEHTGFLSKFVETAGYPLITATYKDKTLSVSQKRFKNQGMDHNDTTLYHVYISWATSGSNFEVIIPEFELAGKEKEDFTLPESPKDYLILNVQQALYYRVNYDEENWKKIGVALRSENHDGIHVLNRAQIVDDLFNLARARVLKYGLVLKTVEFLRNETNYIPWQSAFTALNWISRRMSSEADLKLFTFYINYLTENVHQHLLYSSALQADRRIDIYNRVNVLTWLCKYGHEDCAKHTKKQFAGYLGNKERGLSADYRAVIYCSGVRQGSDVEFKFLIEQYKATLLQVEKLTILQGLACTKEQKLMDEYLNFIITDHVRSQDRSNAFAYAYTANPDSYKLVYDYITRNFKEWRKTMSLTSTLSSVADRFVSKEEIQKLQSFIDTNKDDLSANEKAGLDNVVKAAESTLEWDKNFDDFKEYIRVLSAAPSLATWNILMIFGVIVSYFVVS